MSNYSVTIIFDACKSVDVEAESQLEAAEKAYDEAGHVSLCHHCSGKVEIGDAVRAVVFDENGGQVGDDGWQEEKIYSLTNQRDDLLAALEGLLADMRLRARLDGDVDSDGCVVLNCGNGVLYAVNKAIAKAKGIDHE